MKELKKISIFIFIAVFAGACSDEFLELEPQGLRFEENFYSNPTEVYEGLNAAYDLLGQKYTGEYTYHSTYMMKNIASDDANAGGGNALDMLDWQDIDEFIPDPSNVALLGVWWRSYFGIYRANQIITRVDPSNSDLYVVPSDSSLLRRYVAEAHFLRAYFYYELVTFFGGVPLLDEVLDVSEDYPPRATEEATWAFIESDLRYASQFLPFKSELKGFEKQHGTRGAAQALLGKIYVFQEKYDDAVQVFEDVITSAEYQLDSSYAHIFTPDGEFGVESVFEISHSSSSPADWLANRSRGYEGNVDCQMMGVRELSGSSTHEPGWGFNKAELSLVNAFIDAGDTLRRKVSIYNIDSLNAEQGGNLSWNSDYKYTGWYCNKYAPKEINIGDGIGATELDYNVNERVIRYADVLLLAAEAYMLKPAPDEGKAHDYINMVRDRAGLEDLDPGLSGEALFEAYVEERRLELAMEGHRYHDLIRWGMAGDVLVNQPQAESNNKGSFIEGQHEVFPIPNQEIERSGGVLEQNNY